MPGRTLQAAGVSGRQLPGGLRHLVIVPGHAAFKQRTRDTPEHPEWDAAWALRPFQLGEPAFYIEHIRRGVLHAARDPEALLVFSGSRTRLESGRWSEAASYFQVARKACFWMPAPFTALRRSIAQRTATEEYARDSFENLLFSLCRFRQLAGAYPRRITVVGWAFKGPRFELHRKALRLPPTFRYDGFNDPLDLEHARAGERLVLEAFRRSPYGLEPAIMRKREERNPFRLEHNYGTCPGLAGFFRFIAQPVGPETEFPGRLPWEAMRQVENRGRAASQVSG